MFIIAIHWRIKPDCIDEFKKHWREENSIPDVSHLIHEFLSESFPASVLQYTTWNLDPDSLGDFKSYVTVGLWDDTGDAFKEQIAGYFNDDAPLKEFEKYRRRRVAFNPVEWRVGSGAAPNSSSSGVK